MDFLPGRIPLLKFKAEAGHTYQIRGWIAVSGGKYDVDACSDDLTTGVKCVDAPKKVEHELKAVDYEWRLEEIEFYW